MDDEIRNPVGNEHPLRGCIIGAAIIVVAAAVVVAFCASCTTTSDTDAHNPKIASAVTNAVRIVAEVVVQVREARRDETGEPGAVNSGDPGQTAKPAESGASPAILWKYGRVDGSHAVEASDARIADVKMTSSGMSYRWVKGGCEQLGAADRSDYSKTLACAFFWDEKEQAWIGGKFDFISTSRTSRSWSNVNDCYRGWEPEKFFAAKRHAFCILSTDGMKRTNLEEAK